jgi:hypothetical protein
VHSSAPWTGPSSTQSEWGSWGPTETELHSCPAPGWRRPLAALQTGPHCRCHPTAEAEQASQKVLPEEGGASPPLPTCSVPVGVGTSALAPLRVSEHQLLLYQSWWGQQHPLQSPAGETQVGPREESLGEGLSSHTMLQHL